MRAERLLAATLTAGGLCVLLAHPGLYSRSTAYTAALLAAGCCALLSRSARPPRFLWLSAGALMLSICLSLWANGQVISRALFLPASQLFLLWAGWRLGASRFAQRLWGLSLLVGTALVSGYAFLQSGGYDVLPPATPFGNRRVVSVFENPNYLGNFAACSLPLLIVFFIHASNNARRLGVGIGLALAYGAWLMAGSRGAWLAGGAGVLLVILGLVHSRRFASFRLHWPSLLALGLALVGVTFFAVQKPVIANARGNVTVGERLLSTRYIIEPKGRGEQTEASPATSVQRGDVQVHDTTINHRYFIWQTAWNMVVDQPVWGVGYGEFVARFPEYREAQRGDELYGSLIETQQYENTRYAHNEYLHFWAECGLLGLLALLFLFGTVVFRGVRCAWLGGDRLLWAMLALLCVMFIHSTVSYPLRLSANGMLFWLALGITARWSEDNTP